MAEQQEEQSSLLQVLQRDVDSLKDAPSEATTQQLPEVGPATYDALYSQHTNARLIQAA